MSFLGPVIHIFWLLADQGIFALSNFVLNVLFARWLPEREYGIFSVSFSGYLIISVLHWGMVVEPLLVQSPQITAGHRRSYLKAVIKAHMVLNVLVAVISFIGYFIAMRFDATITAWGMIGAGIGGPMLLLLLTARRLCLIFLSPAVSAVFGFAYFVGVILSAYVLYLNDAGTWFTVWVILGSWGFLCSILIFWTLHRAVSGDEPYSLTQLVRLQSRFAAYATFGTSFSWFRSNGVMLILASIVGLEAVAEMRAVTNLANPLDQINLALTSSWIVQSSRAHEAQHRHPVWRTAIGYGLLLALATLVVWRFDDDLLRLVYDSRYQAGAWMLPLLFATLAMASVESIFTSDLKGRKLLRRGYASPLVGAVTATLCGLILIPLMGVEGAVYAVLISGICGLLVAMIVFR